MAVQVQSSGVFRNRFRLLEGSGLQPQGFTYDDSRMPDKAVDLGTAVIAGSVWDGDNRAAQNKFDIPEISGQLECSDYKSHLTPGLAVFRAGVGDNDDCILSGINNPDSNTWNPVIQPGAFFDLESPLFLHSTDAVELIISGADKRTVLASEPLPPFPVSMATFYVDPAGKAHVYEQFQQKVRFTSISGRDTLEKIANSDPPLYRPTYSGIRWYNINSGLYEFMVDLEVPEIIRSRDIVSGVHAVLRKVPYSRNQYQLPLVPIAAFSGTPTINIYGDRLEMTAGLGQLTMQAYGTVSGLVVTSGGYVRLSGTLGPSGLFIQTESSVASWPNSGILLIDDMVNQVSEQVTYSDVSASGFYVPGARVSGVPHREGSQIRLVISGLNVSGVYVSGTTYDGYHFANYSVAMDSVPSYNEWTGLITLSGSENVARADLDLTYYRGIGLCYEPSGLSEYNVTPNLNINPLVQGNIDGQLWFSMFPLRADRIKVSTNKKKDPADKSVGPVFAGNDFLALTAKVTDRYGAPVPNEIVSISLDSVENIGEVDGASPFDGAITKETNSRGEVNFTYTPPQTIHGLGYFTQFENIVNGSGLQFGTEFELTEVFVSGSWNTLTFAVWRGDEYDGFTESSGTLEYTADGRFEVIAEISGGDLGTYATFTPITPIAALDNQGNILSTSGSVKTLVYSSGTLPGDETDIGAFFVSAEKIIKIGVLAINSQAKSETIKVKVGIPDFMKGELYFGPLEDVDTRSLDSLAYLTINPYTMGFIDENRFDPRQLGNVFRVEGSKTDEYIRNKFYIVPDWRSLDTEPTDSELRKFYSFRNRFILEVS